MSPCKQRIEWRSFLTFAPRLPNNDKRHLIDPCQSLTIHDQLHQLRVEDNFRLEKKVPKICEMTFVKDNKTIQFDENFFWSESREVLQMIGKFCLGKFNSKLVWFLKSRKTLLTIFQKLVKICAGITYAIVTLRRWLFWHFSRLKPVSWLVWLNRLFSDFALFQSVCNSEIFVGNICTQRISNIELFSSHFFNENAKIRFFLDIYWQFWKFVVYGFLRHKPLDDWLYLNSNWISFDRSQIKEYEVGIKIQNETFCRMVSSFDYKKVRSFLFYWKWKVSNKTISGKESFSLQH